MLVPTIGIEVHVELNTKSKAFSNSKNEFNDLPNTNVNVIDLGYPGTLPTLNKEVIESGLKIALALNCKINTTTFFDRKNYFYVDNPKSYQITQNKNPIGYDGYLEIEDNGVFKRIEIEELHIEEDTAKSIHGNNKTLLNYNRAGVPLVEIVTKPCIKSGKEALLYVDTLRSTLEYLGVSDVKIEEGSMRCDANVSLAEEGSLILGTKAEIKNIGSISNVNLAIEYEIKRQTEMINNNEKLIEQTRRFDDKNNKTVLMRLKETGNDYRYFPEPDIPRIEIDEKWINRIKTNMPILPPEFRKRFKEYGLNEVTISVLLQNKEMCYFYVLALEEPINKVVAANLLTGDVISYLNKNNLKLSDTKLNVENFRDLVNNIDNEKVSTKMAKDIIVILINEGGNIKDILKNNNMEQISDKDTLIKIVNDIISSNMESVNDYKEGKDRALKYLMGQIMKETKGMANPAMVETILKEELAKY